MFPSVVWRGLLMRFHVTRAGDVLQEFDVWDNFLVIHEQINISVFPMQQQCI